MAIQVNLHLFSFLMLVKVTISLMFFLSAMNTHKFFSVKEPITGQLSSFLGDTRWGEELLLIWKNRRELRLEPTKASGLEK